MSSFGGMAYSYPYPCMFLWGLIPRLKSFTSAVHIHSAIWSCGRSTKHVLQNQYHHMHKFLICPPPPPLRIDASWNSISSPPRPAVGFSRFTNVWTWFFGGDQDRGKCWMARKWKRLQLKIRCMSLCMSSTDRAQTQDRVLCDPTTEPLKRVVHSQPRYMVFFAWMVVVALL